MDLIGDIVEHDAAEPTVPTMPEPSGFPKRRNIFEKKKGPSRFRSQAAKKVTPKEPASEAERIHQENMQRLSQMSLDEIAKEREELLQNLDPKLVQSLLNKTEKRIHSETHDHVHKHAEGYNEWIGNARTADGWADISQLDKEDVDRALGIQEKFEEGSKVKSNKVVKFADSEDVIDEMRDDPNTQIVSQTEWEDVDDINELMPETADVGEESNIAHKDYQLVEEDEDDVKVHFPKPKTKSLDDMDEDDPNFYDKLHEKYFPDLPKETDKLSWMIEQSPLQNSTTYESILDMRFDFKGNLVELVDETKGNLSLQEIPTHLGLHHHGENPQQAGYTLSELAHLGRSLFPGQRCISFVILGRILHKLGLHKYNIVPVADDDDGEEDQEFNSNVNDMNTRFEKLMWDLIGQLRILETLEEAADEKKSKNLSVRSYAVEALWLWKSGGGKPEGTDKPEQEEDEVMKEILS